MPDDTPTPARESDAERLASYDADPSGGCVLREGASVCWGPFLRRAIHTRDTEIATLRYDLEITRECETAFHDEARQAQEALATLRRERGEAVVDLHALRERDEARQEAKMRANDWRVVTRERATVMQQRDEARAEVERLQEERTQLVIDRCKAPYEDEYGEHSCEDSCRLVAPAQPSAEVERLREATRHYTTALRRERDEARAEIERLQEQMKGMLTVAHVKRTPFVVNPEDGPDTPAPAQPSAKKTYSTVPFTDADIPPASAQPSAEAVLLTARLAASERARDQAEAAADQFQSAAETAAALMSDSGTGALLRQLAGDAPAQPSAEPTKTLTHPLTGDPVHVSTRTGRIVAQPSAEERFDATLDNGGVADHWLGIAAIARAYKDGFSAGLATAPAQPSAAALTPAKAMDELAAETERLKLYPPPVPAQPSAEGPVPVTMVIKGNPWTKPQTTEIAEQPWAASASPPAPADIVERARQAADSIITTVRRRSQQAGSGDDAGASRERIVAYALGLARAMPNAMASFAVAEINSLNKRTGS